MHPWRIVRMHRPPAGRHDRPFRSKFPTSMDEGFGLRRRKNAPWRSARMYRAPVVRDSRSRRYLIPTTMVEGSGVRRGIKMYQRRGVKVYRAPAEAFDDKLVVEYPLSVPRSERFAYRAEVLFPCRAGLCGTEIAIGRSEHRAPSVKPYGALLFLALGTRWGLFLIGAGRPAWPSLPLEIPNFDGGRRRQVRRENNPDASTPGQPVSSLLIPTSTVEGSGVNGKRHASPRLSALAPWLLRRPTLAPWPHSGVSQRNRGLVTRTVCLSAV